MKPINLFPLDHIAMSAFSLDPKVEMIAMSELTAMSAERDALAAASLDPAELFDAWLDDEFGSLESHGDTDGKTGFGRLLGRLKTALFGDLGY